MEIQDFEVARGDSYRMVGWRFPFDLSPYRADVTIRWRRGLVQIGSQDGALIIEQETVGGAAVWVVYWKPTPEQSATIPSGRVARYELVLTRTASGERKTYIEGYAIGRGGLSNAA